METYLSLRKLNHSVARTEPSNSTLFTRYTFYRKFVAKTTDNGMLHETIFKETVLTKFKPPKALVAPVQQTLACYDNYYHHHFYLSYYLFLLLSIFRSYTKYTPQNNWNGFVSIFFRELVPKKKQNSIKYGKKEMYVYSVVANVFEHLYRNVVIVQNTPRIMIYRNCWYTLTAVKYLNMLYSVVISFWRSVPNT